MIGICLLVEFFVLQGVSSNTLAFRKNIEGSALFLGVTIRLFKSNVSEGVSEVVSKLDDHFREKCQVYSMQSSRMSPLLFLGCCLSKRFYLAEYLRAVSCPLVLFETGAPKLLEGLH